MLTQTGSNIFSAVKIVCVSLGVYRYESSWFLSKTNWLINILLTLFEFIHLLSSLAYLSRYHTLGDITEVMSVAFPLILNILQYVLLVWQKNHIWRLFEEFERLIEESNIHIIFKWGKLVLAKHHLLDIEKKS